MAPEPVETNSTHECRRCGEEMTIAHGSGYHPLCDPGARREDNVAPQRRSCRQCGAVMLGLADDGRCGWCVTSRHPARLSYRLELRRRGVPLEEILRSNTDTSGDPVAGEPEPAPHRAHRSGRDRSPLRRRVRADHDNAPRAA